MSKARQVAEAIAAKTGHPVREFTCKMIGNAEVAAFMRKVRKAQRSTRKMNFRIR